MDVPVIDDFLVKPFTPQLKCVGSTTWGSTWGFLNLEMFPAVSGFEP